MSLESLVQFKHIWLVDFEFRSQNGVEGSVPEIVCLVAKEYRSGRTIRLFADQLGNEPPYGVDEESLFVAFFASAEVNCHLALDWPVPVRILDLYTEFRNLMNGLDGNRSLLSAMAFFSLDHIDAIEKGDMRDLVLRGGPWDDIEQRNILDYCESDTEALQKLLPAMLPHIDLPRALLRGRYMAAVARMEYVGVPIDHHALSRIERNRDEIKAKLVASVDQQFGVYDGLTFKRQLFADWLSANGIPWPHNPRGHLRLDDDTFRQMERKHPEVSKLTQLRSFLSDNRSVPLPVGTDGRNRTLLSPFGSSTGRNQPSTTRAIFGRSAWLRSLIKPSLDHGVAYIDWEQQEVGIAAALSDDTALKAAYASGDPYLEFGKQAGAIPAGGTKQSHKAERDRFKACVLAVQYGMGKESLATSAGVSEFDAGELLRLHRETYPQFWRWSESAVDDAFLLGRIRTVFGWQVHVTPGHNHRSLANFPMQANGAEMLRLACCMATEEGIKICAPVHDAVLIEAPLGGLDDHIRRMQEIMAETSRIVLDGFELRTDVEIVRYPDRYIDERGQSMWEEVMALVAEEEASHQ